MENMFTTRAVHAGRHDFAERGIHAPPIDLSSTYPTPDLDAAARSFDSLASGDGPLGSFVYQRLFNPTADHLLDSGLLGLTVTWATQDSVADSIRSDTALVVIETPANPTLDLVDIAHVVRQAAEVPVMVDSTFATPVLQRPLEQGAALVMHSATKFLGGHGDVLAGVVAGSHALIREIKHVRALTGALSHPLASYLLHRGLQTLALRVERAQATAQVLAWRLVEDPRVRTVHFPGLRGQDPRGLLGKQMSGREAS